MEDWRLLVTLAEYKFLSFKDKNKKEMREKELKQDYS